MMRRLVLVLLLAACSSVPESKSATPPDSARHVVVPETPPTGFAPAVFACDDSTEVFALFSHPAGKTGEVALAIGETRVHLPQLVSADGARYGDSTATFWNKGDSATFKRSGKETRCHVVK